MHRSHDVATDGIDVVMERRHSCRSFLDTEIPRLQIDRMLELAQRSASWCNTQPWQLWWLSKDAVADLAFHLTNAAAGREPMHWDIEPPVDYKGDHQLRRRDAGVRLYQAIGVGRHDLEARRVQHLENFRFFGAPHVGILAADSGLGPYAYVDCGVYLGSLLAVAEGMGFATIAQAAIAKYSHIVRERLAMPESSRIVCAIAFGYEDTTHPANGFRTDRAGRNQAVHDVP